jgi:orotidine-5'-phosphate decarboxylase
LTPFIRKLANASQKNRSWLCIGLDLDPDLMPGVKPVDFGRAIIDATRDLVCAYKPNLAFYEALGIEGLRILEQLTEHIPSYIPTIGDAKRGDIGSTAKAYAKAIFSTFGFDAATVNPYLGFDSVEPFSSYRDKGVFVLCRTSNPGASDFQDLRCTAGSSLYEEVARKAREWNVYGNIGLVVGATYPEELRRVRSICPDMPFLIPGIGAQGGDLASAVNYGMDAKGEKGIVTVSRQIIYASKGGDFAEAARNVAEEIREQINGCLAARSETGRC